MCEQAELRSLATTVLHSMGDLGFDSTRDAMNAICSHDDWQTRFDIEEMYVPILEAWRAETVARFEAFIVKAEAAARSWKDDDA